MEKPNKNTVHINTPDLSNSSLAQMDSVESLYRLVYVSQIRYLYLLDYQIFDKLRFSAFKNNQRLNLTGVLCFGNGFFLQYIEGSEQNLTNLKNILLQDKRHHNLHLFDFSKINNRRFPTYPRGFVLMDYKNQSNNPELKQHLPFKPLQMDIDEQLLIFEKIANSNLLEKDPNLSSYDFLSLRIQLLTELFQGSFNKHGFYFIFEIILAIVTFFVLIKLIFTGQ